MAGKTRKVISAVVKCTVILGYIWKGGGVDNSVQKKKALTGHFNSSFFFKRASCSSVLVLGHHCNITIANYGLSRLIRFISKFTIHLCKNFCK